MPGSVVLVVIHELALDTPEPCRSVLLIDAYPCHLEPRFREWLKAEYPCILVTFVPASCTSHLQIADVAINLTFKMAVARHYTASLASIIMERSAKGTPKDQLYENLPTTTTQVAPHLLGWAISAFEDLKPEPVRSALTNIGYDKIFNSKFQSFSMTAATDLFPNYIPAEEGPMESEYPAPEKDCASDTDGEHISEACDNEINRLLNDDQWAEGQRDLEIATQAHFWEDA